MLKNYLKGLLLLALLEFLVLLIFFFKNTASPVAHLITYPGKNFPLYQLFPDGSVQVHLLDAILVASILALPFAVAVPKFVKTKTVPFVRKEPNEPKNSQ